MDKERAPSALTGRFNFEADFGTAPLTDRGPERRRRAEGSVWRNAHADKHVSMASARHTADEVLRLVLPLDASLPSTSSPRTLKTGVGRKSSGDWSPKSEPAATVPAVVARCFGAGDTQRFPRCAAQSKIKTQVLAKSFEAQLCSFQELANVENKPMSMVAALSTNMSGMC